MLHVRHIQFAIEKRHSRSTHIARMKPINAPTPFTAEKMVNTKIGPKNGNAQSEQLHCIDTHLRGIDITFHVQGCQAAHLPSVDIRSDVS